MFEVYLELLNQVKLGNNDEDTIMKCTNLSPRLFDEAIDPLVSEKLLKKSRRYEGDKRIIVYELSDKGNQFIDFITLGIAYAEELSSNIRPARTRLRDMSAS